MCLFFFSSSSSFFVHHSVCVKTAHPLSLSLFPLKKSTKKRTRRNSIIRETLILRKKNERTIKRIEQNTLFIYSLSLSLSFFRKNELLFRCVVFAKTLERRSFLLLYLSSVLLFPTSSCFDDDDFEEEKMCAFVITVSLFFLERD